MPSGNWWLRFHPRELLRARLISKKVKNRARTSAHFAHGQTDPLASSSFRSGLWHPFARLTNAHCAAAKIIALPAPESCPSCVSYFAFANA